MPDSFFASTKPRKRKRSVGHDNAPSTSKKPTRTVNGKPSAKGPQKGRGGAALQNGKRRAVDEELSDETSDDDEGAGIDEMDLRAPDVDPDAYESGEEDEDETPAEKRLRLAKLYLEGVKQTLADGEFDAAEIDRELISARLKQDVMEHSGKVHLFVADSFHFVNPPTLRTRGHRYSVTAAVVSPDARYIFTSAKDGNIIKHDLKTGKILHTFHKQRTSSNGKGKAKEVTEVHGHTDEIWALAISVDGKYLASGGKDRRVGVWDLEKDVWVRGFGGHRDSISALAFRKAAPNASTSTQLYTASFDRTLKLFDLTSMGYVETLFGHQASVLALDALRAETAVSVGGRDKTVRFWKVPEESQLVFRGGGGSRWEDELEGMEVDREDEGEGGVERKEKKAAGKKKAQEKFVEGSIDCVAMIDETTFVSGGDSGSICLWSTQKKKPVFTQALAHGLDVSQADAEDVEIVRKPRWVTAVGALRYSDLFASGSWDGEIRLWKLDAKLRSFALIGTVSAPGVVNSLQFITPPKGSLEQASWASPTQSSEGDASSNPSYDTQGRSKSSSEAVMLVAGIGKETRFGRWIQKKGEGIVNGAFAFLLLPRTSRS